MPAHGRFKAPAPNVAVSPCKPHRSLDDEDKVPVRRYAFEGGIVPESVKAPLPAAAVRNNLGEEERGSFGVVVVMPYNNAMQRTGTRQRGRAESATKYSAPPARGDGLRAAADRNR